MKKFVVIFCLIAAVVCAVTGGKMVADAYKLIEWRNELEVVKDEVDFEYGTKKEDKYVQHSVTNKTGETKTIRIIYEVKDNYYWKIGHIEDGSYTIEPGETAEIKVYYTYLAEKIGCDIRDILVVRVERIIYE